MENELLAERKLAIFKRIMQIENEDKLNQVQIFIEKFLFEDDDLLNDNNIDKQESDETGIYDASVMSFQDWNEQFKDNKELDEYIPEYGMLLKDFRLMIYESEKSPNHPIKKFYDKLETYV